MDNLRNNWFVYAVIGVVVFLLAFVFLFSTKDAGATYIPKVNICHFDGQSGNFQTLNIAIPAAIAHLTQHEPDYSGECEEPPVIDVCENLEGVQESLPQGYHFDGENYCVENEEEEPRDEPKGNGTGNVPENPHTNTTNPPAVATCTIPFEVARTWYDDGELHWASDAQGIQKFSITYGPSEDQLIYGIDNIVSTARAVAKPESNWNQTWFSVWSWKDGCANVSTPIDP